MQHTHSLRQRGQRPAVAISSARVDQLYGWARLAIILYSSWVSIVALRYGWDLAERML